MEEGYQDLIDILEASVKKNGVQPLTNEWLLNILKLANGKLTINDLSGEGWNDMGW